MTVFIPEMQECRIPLRIMIFDPRFESGAFLIVRWITKQFESMPGAVNVLV